MSLPVPGMPHQLGPPSSPSAPRLLPQHPIPPVPLTNLHPVIHKYACALSTGLSAVEHEAGAAPSGPWGAGP